MRPAFLAIVLVACAPRGGAPEKPSAASDAYLVFSTDGKEAVTFLVTLKDLLEDPARLLLDI